MNYLLSDAEIIEHCPDFLDKKEKYEKHYKHYGLGGGKKNAIKLDISFQVGSWINFYTKLYNRDKKYPILEFGPRAGFGLYVAEALGYKIRGLEIDPIENPELKILEIHQECMELLDVRSSLKTYSGEGKFPFRTSYFGSIISKSSIHRIDNRPKEGISRKDQIEYVYKDRFSEIERVCRKDSHVYISPCRKVPFVKQYLKTDKKRFTVCGIKPSLNKTDRKIEK